jgi:hypothetical protein
MRLSVKGLAVTAGIIWGACLLLVGLINLAAPSYGADFLRGMGSIYPGFYRVHTFLDVLLGTVYGFVDGAIAGWLFGWLYNCFAGPARQSGTATLNRAA